MLENLSSRCNREREKRKKYQGLNFPGNDMTRMNTGLRLKFKLPENKGYKFLTIGDRNLVELQQGICNIISKESNVVGKIILKKNGSNYLVLSSEDTLAINQGDELLLLEDNIDPKSLRRAFEIAPKIVEEESVATFNFYPHYDTIPTFSALTIPKLDLGVQRSFVDSFRKNGYAYVTLSDQQLEQVNKCFVASRKYFSFPLEMKEKCTIEGNLRTYGYKHLPSLNKEYLKVRKTDYQRWPEDPYYQKTCYDTYDTLHLLTKDILWLLLQYVGFSKEDFIALTQFHPPYPVSHEFSTSFLEIFHYFANNQAHPTVPCPHHGMSNNN
jgi:hypothetical protein